MPPKIIVTNRVFPETVRLLEHCGDVVANEDPMPWPRRRLLQEAADASAVMAFMPDVVDDAFLDACPRLRIVACALKGYDNYDVQACTRRGIWLTIVPDLLTLATAELAVGLIIALSRRILAGDGLVRAGRFAGWRPMLYGRSLDESVVGVLGGGAIGKAVARKLAGFESSVLVHDPVPRGLLPSNAKWSSVEEVTGRADYVVLALPLERATFHLVNRAFIAKLKPGAVLVNVARGSLVDEAEVVRALQDGRLGGYAADVYEFEDVAQTRSSEVHSGLRAQKDRTVLTPHLGSAVASVRRRIEEDAARNITEALSGRRPHGAVNQV